MTRVRWNDPEAQAQHDRAAAALGVLGAALAEGRVPDRDSAWVAELRRRDADLWQRIDAPRGPS